MKNDRKLTITATAALAGVLAITPRAPRKPALPPTAGRAVRVEIPDGLAPMPVRLARRGVDAEGWPVPFYSNGVANHAVDMERLRVCCEDRRCGMCGDPLGKHVAFALSAKAALLSLTTLPGMHRECCEWLVSRRLPEVFVVWCVEGAGKWRKHGARVIVSAPEEVAWYFDGAAAPRSVVVAALNAALGELVAVLTGVEDTEAVIGRHAALIEEYLPAEGGAE